MQFQHLDAAGLHLADHVGMILLSLFNPDHVVKQQVMAIGGGQPLVCQAGMANHHRAQFAAFGMGSKLGHVQLLERYDAYGINKQKRPGCSDFPQGISEYSLA